MTTPRCLINQRLATMEPNTRARQPVPEPTNTPQRAISCQLEVINTVRPVPKDTRTSAIVATDLIEKRSMSVAENGATRP